MGGWGGGGGEQARSRAGGREANVVRSMKMIYMSVRNDGEGALGHCSVYSSSFAPPLTFKGRSHLEDVSYVDIIRYDIIYRCMTCIPPISREDLRFSLNA